VGRNGKGKTTLLKLLAGELTPDAGVIERHPQTRAAYFSQDQSRTLFEERTVEQEVVVSLPAGERHRARDLCGVMMFSKDAAFKKVKVLSGGERSRVCLAKTLGTPANLLYLDEPTHHLDLESSDALMDAIRRFEGAVLLVTHSEHLLKHAVNRLIVFKENRVFVFEGGYLEMIERHGWDELEPGFDSSSQSTAVSRRKRARRERARFVAERARAIKPLERKIASIEKRIDEREVLITRNNRALVEASKIGDAGAIEKLSRERSRIEREIEELYPLLLEAGETLENEKKRFEREEAETAENQSCSDA
jgi:ATP-binding cassette subfamily F protein 3